MLKFHLFGNGSAHNGGRPLEGFPCQQAGMLLCYLLLHRSQPISRERLAAVFWEDLPSANARGYLRNALWRLRRMLQDAGADPDHVLSFPNEQVALQAEADMWIDIDEFERAAADASKAGPESLSRVQVEALESAAALYTGDLLQGVYEDWTLYERERLRLIYLNIRHKLMLHHGAFARYELALQHGEQILVVDPAREKIHRQMMRLHALSGDRSAAFAQYKRCKQVLQEELGLAPMQETRQLYRQIKENLLESGPEDAEGQLDATPGVLRRLHSLRRLSARFHAELHSLEKLLNRNVLDTDSS